MPTQEKNEERFCLFCDRRIETGARPEKVYCNVDCNNNYNSRKKAELKAQGSPYQTEIIKNIKNNYQILLEYKSSKGQLKTSKIPIQELVQKGFKPEFFTSCYQEPNHRLWKCCFDIGYTEETNYYFRLSYMPFHYYIDEDTQEQVIVQSKPN